MSDLRQSKDKADEYRSQSRRLAQQSISKEDEEYYLRISRMEHPRPLRRTLTKEGWKSQ